MLQIAEQTLLRWRLSLHEHRREGDAVFRGVLTERLSRQIPDAQAHAKVGARTHEALEVPQRAEGCRRFRHVEDDLHQMFAGGGGGRALERRARFVDGASDDRRFLRGSHYETTR